jgi:hypothetical protein
MKRGRPSGTMERCLRHHPPQGIEASKGGLSHLVRPGGLVPQLVGRPGSQRSSYEPLTGDKPCTSVGGAVSRPVTA